MEYIIVEDFANSFEATHNFVKQVQEKIDEGFKPLPGGFTIVCGSEDDYLYAQAMIRENEED